MAARRPPPPVDTVAWHAWLEEGATQSFAFRGIGGHFTARREGPQGRRYWYAYRTLGRKTHRAYLGKSSNLTQARLDEVAGVLAAGAPVPQPAGAPHALVGRARERARLREALAAALDGRGGLVLLAGEAGIGKTALAEDLAREATTRGALTLAGRCYDLAATPPYGPWRDAFRHVVLLTGQPALPAALQVGARRARAGSPAALFEQAHAALAALARDRPLVLLLDDLHWADPASLDLARALARDLARALARDLAALPALLVASYRPEELTRRHPLREVLPALVREAGPARIEVRPLDDDAVGGLVVARYHQASSNAARLVAWLRARAEGNPFFAVRPPRRGDQAQGGRGAALPLSVARGA